MSNNIAIKISLIRLCRYFGRPSVGYSSFLHTVCTQHPYSQSRLDFICDPYTIFVILANYSINYWFSAVLACGTDTVVGWDAPRRHGYSLGSSWTTPREPEQREGCLHGTGRRWEHVLLCVDFRPIDSLLRKII